MDVGRRIIKSCLYEYPDVIEDFVKSVRDFPTQGIITNDSFEVARVIKEAINIKE